MSTKSTILKIMYINYINIVIRKENIYMELLHKQKTFKTKEGQEVTYDIYYVECYGKEVQVKPVNDFDKSLLKVAIKNGN